MIPKRTNYHLNRARRDVRHAAHKVRRTVPVEVQKIGGKSKHDALHPYCDTNLSSWGWYERMRHHGVRFLTTGMPVERGRWRLVSPRGKVICITDDAQFAVGLRRAIEGKGRRVTMEDTVYG